ncbi:MAG: hypothetical protein KDK23_08200 [Leptospiraceae bacterium]|nr:hypothetical protein [Leptospiraceae bacterium]
MQKAWQARILILPLIWAGFIYLLNLAGQYSGWPRSTWLFDASDFPGASGFSGGAGIIGYAAKTIILLLFVGGTISFRVASVAHRFPVLALASLLLSYGLLSGGGTFFSDDAIRHEVDGAYIARDLPLYCISPDELGLPEGLERMPNHSHLATIYPPGTQWLSYLGAIGPGFRGIYNLLFLALCIPLLWPAFRRRSVDGTEGIENQGDAVDVLSERGLPVASILSRSLLFHPIWMILFFSGHTDVLALLLCINVALLLLPGRYALSMRQKKWGPCRKVHSDFIAISSRRSGLWQAKERFAAPVVPALRVALAGALWAFACSVKPEALLSGLFFLSYLASSRNTAAGRARKSTPGILVRSAFFGAGVLFTALPLLQFSLHNLFHLATFRQLGQISTSEGSSLELECFFYTTRVFSDYFISYRPDAVWLAGVESISSAEAIALVRMIWLPAWAVLGLGFALHGFRSAFFAGPTGIRSSGSLWRVWSRPISTREGRLLPLAEALRNLFLFLLSGYFLYRGSWQPWYFLWFVLGMPGLWDYRAALFRPMSAQPRPVDLQDENPLVRHRTPGMPHPKSGIYSVHSLRHSFFLSLPILFYLPVADYRVDGSFDLSFFYCSLLLVFALYVMYNRRQH